MQAIKLTGIENRALGPSGKLVIEVKWGGIGNHLFYSHIPQVAKQSGRYKKVFISNNSEYKSPLYKHLAPRINHLRLKNVPFFESATLEEYISIIVLCKKFYCLTSGSATLAAALNKPANILYGECVKNKFHHSKMHNYVFIQPDKKTLITKIGTCLRQVFAKR